MIALPIGAARANHIKIESNSQPPAPPYPAPAPSQTIHITAQQFLIWQRQCHRWHER
jgi:hypothetical protein